MTVGRAFDGTWLPGEPDHGRPAGDVASSYPVVWGGRGRVSRSIFIMRLGYLGSGHVHFSISAYFFMIFTMHAKTRKHGKIHILVGFAPLDLM